MTEYLFPGSVEEAVALLAEHEGEAQVIAGGTDILPDIRTVRDLALRLEKITNP